MGTNKKKIFANNASWTFDKNVAQKFDYHINKSDQKNETFMIQKASNQISIFNEEELLLRKRINELDLNTMTPIEALHILDDIKKEHDI